MTNRIRFAAVALAVCIGAVAPSAAHAAERRLPVNDGGDSSRCVTYTEFMVVANSAHITRGQVRRVFDTDGRPTSTGIMDQLAGMVHTQPGTEVVVPRHRAVRQYQGCPDTSNPAGDNVYVEYRTHPRHTSARWRVGPATTYPLTRHDTMVAAYWD